MGATYSKSCGPLSVAISGWAKSRATREVSTTAPDGTVRDSTYGDYPHQIRTQASLKERGVFRRPSNISNELFDIADFSRLSYTKSPGELLVWVNSQTTTVTTRLYTRSLASLLRHSRQTSGDPTRDRGARVWVEVN